MNRVLIDILDGSGQKLGSGPIVTCLDWRQTARLNRAGEFSFSMPAADSRAAECRPKRFARCWLADGAGLRQIGMGRIERVGVRETDTGPMLDVSGVDLLGELADRQMRREAIRAETEIHPPYVSAGDQDYHLEMYDNEVGDTDTYYRYQPGYYIIGSIHKFHKITFVLGASVNDSKTAVFTYLSGSSWNSLTVTDGTNNLSQSGTIEFDPSQFVWNVATGGILYKVKIEMTGGIDEDVDVCDVSIHYYEPTSTPMDIALEYAPAGWSLDAALGYSEMPKRPLSGTELVLNNGFENYITNGANQEFTSWTNIINGDANVLADLHDGSACVKCIANGAEGGTVDFGAVEQEITVLPGMEYTLSFWTRGDGAHDGQFRIRDADIGDANGNLINLQDTNVTAATWTQVSMVFTTPQITTSILIRFLSPADGSGAYALFDDVSLQVGGGGGIYLQASGESVLEMLTRIADVSGENFILSPSGRKVLWLGNDDRTLNLRAVSLVDPIAVEDEDTLCLITGITEIEDASEVVTRVYPYGSGMGASRVTLANCNTAAPDGYTVSTADNYVQHDAAYAALGLIEIERYWPDISEHPDDVTLPESSAANILMFQTVNWLSTHTATSTDRLTGDVPRFYTLSIAKCNQLVLPGYKLRVTHHRYINNYHAVAIDADLWITAATWRVGLNGAATVALDVATVPRPAVNDALALATGIRRIISTVAHNTAAGY